ncbi:MAG TPA: hypothetical protein PKU97_21610 [Kofleriaceae bacterium]|nr:hypothetical protein [Kofleriaceae bacterium]
MRVTPATAARLTLYFRPSGYEQTSSRSRPAPGAFDGMPGGVPGAFDPYAYP